MLSTGRVRRRANDFAATDAARMTGVDGQRPIGWWVKRLDGLLERVVDSAVAGEGVIRRHWQVLQSLAEGAADEDGLRSVLADFPGDVGVVLADLVERGWVDRGAGDRVTLTAEGRSAHDRIAATVGAVRRQVADGVSAEEYESTLRVLGRMVTNVERALGH
jgi:DNA-binding MarR family transcriptional regulator